MSAEEEKPKKQKRNTSGLIPFKKGHPGGPGRPKLPDLKEIMAKVLGKETEEGKTEAEQILEALKRQAKAGNVKASQILLDRGFGKVKESLDITTDGEKINNQPKIQIEIVTNGKGKTGQQES
jgi:dihydropteroate synthase